MKNRIAKIVGILSIVWSGTCVAQNVPTPASVQVCTNIEEKTCKYAVLPTKAGHVIHLVRGNWVSPVAATASWVAFTQHHASLCYMGSKTIALECFPIRAYAPKDADISFRDMGSGLKAMVYERRPGATQPHVDFYRSVDIFNRALHTTAQEAQEHAKNTYHLAVAAALNARNDGAQKRGRPEREHYDQGAGCLEQPENPACRYQDDSGYSEGAPATWDPPSDHWEYDKSTWFPANNVDAGAGDGWNYDRVIIGPPEREPEWENTFFPPFHYEWQYAPEVAPDLPPTTGSVPVVVISAPKCVYSPLGMVCTSPPAAPIPIDPADQITPPRPWNPSIPTWNFCKTFGIFCSVDNDRGEGSTHDGKTLEELAQICLDISNREHVECDAYVAADYRTRRACHERVEARYSACLTTARNVARK